jgi:hypothetical protein
LTFQQKVFVENWWFKSLSTFVAQNVKGPSKKLHSTLGSWRLHKDQQFWELIPMLMMIAFILSFTKTGGLLCCYKTKNN